MPAVRFLHLRGNDAWGRCAHSGTVVHAPTGTVRLERVEKRTTARLSAAAFARWRAARRGLLRLPTPPDLCDPLVAEGGAATFTPGRGGVLLAGDGSDRLLTPSEGGWVPARPTPSPSGSPLSFRPQPAPVGGARALDLDPRGRVWALSHDGKAIRLLSPVDLTLLDVIAPPHGVTLDAVVAYGGGLAAIGSDRALWLRSRGGEWSALGFRTPSGRDVPWDDSEIRWLREDYLPVSLTANGGRLAVVLRRDSSSSPGPMLAPLTRRTLGALPHVPDAPALVLLVEGERAWVHVLSELEDPLPSLLLPDGSLLVGELGPEQERASAGRLELTRFVVDADGAHPADGWLARAFDGRGLLLDSAGRPWATTPRGLRRVFPVLEPRHTAGVLQTEVLDAQTHGAQWHRVFLDACLPEGTSIEVSAFTSDDEGDVDPLALAASGSTALSVPGDATARGWVTLSALDRRRPWVDVPLPATGALPALDPHPREPAPPDVRFETLEGLLRVAPARFLSLRIRMRGTRRLTPALVALRVTHPRPSLLNFLPSFWRRDPKTARQLDELLSLYEGPLTELGQRIELLPLLFDPRVCPPEMLDWLASFLGIALDKRLAEGVRRQLIREAFRLYKQRGTVPGLERLLTIITGCRVQVIEAFRLRPPPPWVLGSCGPRGGEGRSILDGTLSLGTEDVDLAPWERELVDRWQELLDVRAQQWRRHHAARRAGREPDRKACCGTHELPDRRPCPEDDPPHPLDLDPVVSFYRRTAFRFSVILTCCKTPELERAVERAIETWKPAHTIHQTCWAGAGFRLGAQGSYLGVATHLSEPTRSHPLVLDDTAAALGQTAILGSIRGGDSPCR